MTMADPMPQEPKPLRQSIMLDAAEKEAIRLVSAIHRITESDLIRDWTMRKIMREYAKLAPAVENAKKGAAA
jgi:hypothetical protein